MSKSHYDILKVPIGAEFQELKRAYYARAKELHPDRHGGSALKEAQFKEVVAAFELLSDPVRRARYDIGLGVGSGDTGLAVRTKSIMDTDADDTLEEIIVGNSLPVDTSIGTIFRDLERTEIFVLFREAKSLYYQKKFKSSLALFHRAVVFSPNNIIYRCYLGRTLALLHRYKESQYHYRVALSIGERRDPPQRMYQLRREFEAVNRLYRPFWSRVLSFFVGSAHDPFIPCSSDSMVAEMNRVMQEMLDDDLRKDQDVKKLDK